MAEKSLLDTINEAITSEGGSPAAEPVAPVIVDTDTHEDTNTALEDGADGAKPEGEADKPADGEKPESEQTDEEKAAAKAAADAEAAEAAAATEAAKGLTAEQKAEADKKRTDAKAKDQTENPIDAPIPRDLKPETQQRIRTLVKTTKELRDQVTKATADRDELISIVQDTGASPEQFGEALNLLKRLNSTAPKDQEAALDYLLKAAEEMSRRVGRPMPGVNMLKDHADLMADVQNGTITRARAEEIAAARESRKAQDRHAEAARTAGAQTQAVEDGKSKLTVLGQELAARDGLPLYNAKAEKLIPALKPTLSKADPTLWPAIFRAAYEAIPAEAFRPKPAPAAPAANGGGGVPANQPLRSRTPAGGQQKAPSSMLDAVNQALAGAA